MRRKTGLFDRRTLIGAGAALAVAHPVFGAASPFAEIERRAKGRLGVAVLDVGGGRRLSYRADERFPMCSTFKLLLAVYVLVQVDAGRESLDRRIPYAAADLLEYAPTTRAHVAQGAMSMGDLCIAAVQLSDNTAANLILKEIGGPAVLTVWLRGIGDPTTRLDNNEPKLNVWAPGDVHDTTTPAAMVATLHKVLIGSVLSSASLVRLVNWMKGTTTGLQKIRAGIPADWSEGDKTGSWSDAFKGTSNDVAILRPSEGGLILVAAYLCNAAVPNAEREAALADVGRVIAREFARG
jgi:beta-lactamase class A